VIRVTEVGEWTKALQKYAFRAAPGAGELPQLSTAASSLFVPSTPRFIQLRNIGCWTDSGDQIVGAGGATLLNLTLRISGGGAQQTLISAAIATYNDANLKGGGYSFPSAIGNLEFVVYGAGAMTPGRVTSNRGLWLSTDAGTATGVFYLQFEWRSFTPAGIGTLPL